MNIYVLIAGIIGCGAVTAAFVLVVKKLLKHSMEFYNSKHDNAINGRVSDITDEQSFGFFKKNNKSTAYPVYKAKVNNKYMESMGFIRYDTEELEKKKKTKESIPLYYDRVEDRLWNLDEIPARRRQMMIQSAVMIIIISAVIILPIVLRN